MFLEKGDGYTGYAMVKEQDHVTGYRKILLASNGALGNLAPGGYPNFDNPTEGVGDDEDWDFNRAIGGKSIHHFAVKRKYQDLHDKCRIMKRMVLTNVAEVFELAQELLCLANVPVNAVPSAEFPVTARGDTIGLAAELDKAKVRIAKLESVDVMTNRRHKELLNEAKQRHAEEVRV